MTKKNKKKKRPATVPSKPQPEKKAFKCLRCGYCCICSTPAFTKEEYKRVRDLPITRARDVKFQKVADNKLDTNGHIYKEYAYFTANGYFTYNMTADQAKLMSPPPCEFLDKNEDGTYSCAIYAYRPLVCKDFGVKEWPCPNNPDYLKKGS